MSAAEIVLKLSVPSVALLLLVTSDNAQAVFPGDVTSVYLKKTPETLPVSMRFRHQSALPASRCLAHVYSSVHYSAHHQAFLTAVT